MCAPFPTENRGGPPSWLVAYLAQWRGRQAWPGGRASGLGWGTGGPCLSGASWIGKILVIIYLHLFNFVGSGEQRRRVVCVRKEDSFIVSDIRCESSGYKKPPELIQKCNLHCSIRYLTFTGPSHCSFHPWQMDRHLFVTEAVIVI